VGDAAAGLAERIRAICLGLPEVAEFRQDEMSLGQQLARLRQPSRVLLGLAESFHLTAVVVQSPGPVDGCQAAVWALMAISPEALAYPAIASAGLPLGDRINPVLWTDDYSNLFRALRY